MNTQQPDILKIMTVSLSDASKYKAFAVFNGEQLVITHITPLRGMFGQWRDDLIAEISNRVESGFAVLVEERTDVVSQYATRYMLEDRDDETGRSKIFEALDWYFALLNTDSIIFHPECKQMMIKSGGEGQKVEKLQDENGRTYYRIDWANFHGGFRAMLLCVVAAMTEPVSERYLNVLCDGEDVVSLDTDFDWRRAFRSITSDYDNRKRMEWMEQEDSILNRIRGGGVDK